MVDVHCCFDVMVIEGLARPMLAGINLLRALRATIDFDMAALTIPGSSSINTRMIILSRHVDGKGVCDRMRKGVEYADEISLTTADEIKEVLSVEASSSREVTGKVIHMMMVELVDPAAEGESEENISDTDGDEEIKCTQDRPIKGTYTTRYFTKKETWDVLQEATGEPSAMDDETTSLETDIYEDLNAIEFLKNGNCNEQWNRRERKRVIQRKACGYSFKGSVLYKHDKIVPKQEERVPLIIKTHEELSHMGAARVLETIQRIFFWSNRTEQVKAVIKSCKVCQLTKGGGKLRSTDIELHSIPVTRFMHRIALDTAGPLPCTTWQ